MTETYQELRKQLLDNVEAMIRASNLEEAYAVIEEIEKHDGVLAEDDLRLLLMKGVIHQQCGQLYEAELIFLKCMRIDPYHEDTLYNLFVVYCQIGNLRRLEAIGKQLYYLTSDEATKQEIYEVFASNGLSLTRKVLIGTPVYQEPAVLKEYLESLQNLNIEGLDVYFYFVDDNRDRDSSLLLETFAQDIGRTIVVKSNQSDIYNKNNETHYWSSSLMRKVGKFKDTIIEYARDMNFDYLLFVDSDIVLHRDTLRHLISVNKEIVSEIFWTKWNTNDTFYPQVWISDFYNQFYQDPNESIDTLEAILRKKQFFDMLRKPGVYEVGGLGALTLISNSAIQLGISFREMSNLTFKGEDRHFCIRAAGLGIKLHVDTTYPAYHIYRKNELPGALEFKKSGIFRRKRSITLITEGFSGCNAIALYKLANPVMFEKYDIRLIPKSSNLNHMDTMIDSDMIVSTNANFFIPFDKLETKPILLETWHGFPIKAMLLKDKNETRKELLVSNWQNVDYLASYSKLYGQLMHQCTNVDLSKEIVTGMPRNDFLFIKDGKEKLEQVFNRSFASKKVIFYMPTYRKSKYITRTEGQVLQDNYFGFADFNVHELDKYLTEKNCVMILKCHPAEANDFRVLDDCSSILHLRNEKINEVGFDLYELLSAADMLITDYSSVYFDLLLKDIPLLFTHIDKDYYNDQRGFLVEPTADWFPGFICDSQQSLIDAIETYRKNPRLHRRERNILKNRIHQYQDANSSNRLWNFIDKIMNAKFGD